MPNTVTFCTIYTNIRTLTIIISTVAAAAASATSRGYSASSQGSRSTMWTKDCTNTLISRSTDSSFVGTILPYRQISRRRDQL